MKKALGLLFLVAFTALFFMPIEASPAVVTVTHYLHKNAAVGVVNGINTGGFLFNTTQTWSGSVQERASVVAAGSSTTWSFYLYPVLAGSMVHNGAPSVVGYFKSNASVNDITYNTTISKVSALGSKTSLSTKSNGAQSVGTSYAALTSTHGSLSATVALGFNLELNITLGGSASNLTLTVGFDVSTRNSRLNLLVDDPLTITLSSDKTIYEWDDQATMTATVTDIWGGYDISSAPTILWSTPYDVQGTTSALSTGASQYTNTYTYSLTPKDEAGPGDWIATSSVSDKTGNSYTSSSYDFELRHSGSPWQSQQDLQETTDYTPIVVVCVVVAVGILALKFRAKPKRRKKRR